MIEVLKGVWPLFVAIGFLMTGNGLQGTLLGLRANLEGFDAATIGLVMSAYYCGFLSSSFLTPVLIGRVGHIRVFAAFASIASTTVLLHAVFPYALMWLGLRFVTGFALAGLYVVAESWLNHASTTETRGRTFSIYMIVMYACMALGQGILVFSQPESFLPFIIVSILVSMALVPVSLNDSPAPKIEKPKAISLLEIYRASPLGTFGCFAVGVAQSAFLGMGAVYAARVGLTTIQIGIVMAVGLLGVVPVQFPIGWISDRLDRRLVITCVAFLVGAIAVVATFAGQNNFVLMIIIFGLYGAFSAPLYSLAIAHTNDYLDYDQMLGGSSKLVFVNGVGAVAGPILVGLLMTNLGAYAFFAYAAFIHIALGGFALWRMTRRATVAAEDRADFVHVAVRATPVATATAIEESDEAIN